MRDGVLRALLVSAALAGASPAPAAEPVPQDPAPKVRFSADHLEHTDEAGVEALARANAVAVLLPGAFYFLRETKLPPIEALRKHGVPMALATDCNPGTSPITSPGAILNMACTLFRLTPEEALAGMTCHAAQALGLQSEIGTLETGKRADVVLWDCDHPAQLAAQIGMFRARAVVFDGHLVLG